MRPVSLRRRRGGLLSFGLLAALLLRSRGLPLPLPGCPLRALTGVPCPTCFLTRSILASLHGDLGEALELHLFGPPMLVGLGWSVWWQGVKAQPFPRLTRKRMILFACLVAALMTYWCVRLVLWLGLGLPQPS